jgi:hypothetical protein
MTNGFRSGVIYSAGILVRLHGEDTIAIGLLRTIGIGSAEALKESGAEDHDIKAALPLFETLAGGAHRKELR